MALPNHHPLPPTRPATLAEAVARARFPRNRATVQLRPHRKELLRLRSAGDSVESLVGGLRLIGIEIGLETLRQWLQRELGQRPGKRRTRRILSGQATTSAGSVTPPAAPNALISSLGEAPRAQPAPAPPGHEHPSPLVLPDETPAEALRRRIAERRQRDAASMTAPSAGSDSGAATHSMPPS